MIATRHLSAALVLVALAAPALAQTAEPTPREKLLAAIAANGCQVNSTNHEAILAQSGVEAAAAEELVGALIAAGEALPEGDVLLLKTEGCN